jgi:Ca2+-binding RTX toxin-like protein
MTKYYLFTNLIGSGDQVTLSSGDYLYVAPNVQVASDDASNAVKILGGSTSMDIFGSLAGKYGIYSDASTGGGNNTITVWDGGSVFGLSVGIDLQYVNGTSAGFNTIVNDGTIGGDDLAVIVKDNDTNLVNSGEITSQHSAIELDGYGNNIRNNGHITGVHGYALYFGSPTGTSYLTNAGTIEGDGEGGAIAGHGTSSLVITNVGDIIGTIYFGNGDSIYRGAGGSCGRVVGGDGDDIIKAGVGDSYLYGGKGDDQLKAGNGDDLLSGDAGADRLFAGTGEDAFHYGSVANSTSGKYDTIFFFDADRDGFQISSVPKAIDPTVSSGTLNSGSTFDANLASAIGSAQLKAHHAALFTPDAGNLKGHVFLIVDANGTAGYQAGADYVIELKHPVNIADLSTDNFFL